MSEQSVRTTSVPKLASLSQDDLELRENTGGLRVTLENLTKEEGRLCTCWCQVKINHLNFMSFWRNVGLFKILATVIYTKYTDRSKFEVSPGLGPLFYDASLLRFVTLHMVNLKCFSFLKKYMEKLWHIFVSEGISLFTAQVWFLRIEGSGWLQLLLSMLHI